MLDFNFSNYFDQIVDNNIASYDEVCLVTNICGNTTDTLDDILYVRTGNRSWDQYCEEVEIENVFEDEDDEEDYE